MDISYAKMFAKECFDGAFSKNIGTKQGRVDFAKRIVRRIPCNDPCFLVWAVDYCSNWTPEVTRQVTP